MVEEVKVAKELKSLESFAPDEVDGEEIFLVPIEEIVIKPRQRKTFDLDYIGRLATSIRRAGLLHPIILEDESNELVAGFSRIQAYLALQRDRIPARRRATLTDLQKKVIELEENVQRLGLEWWEKAAAVAEIHAIQKELNPEGWTQAQTAEMIGESVGTVNQSIQLKQELEINPEIKDHSTLVGALKMVKDQKQFAEREKQLKKKKEGKIKLFPAVVVEGDALELIQEESDETYDAIFTNFPFGVELSLGKSAKEVYADEEDYIIKLVRGVTQECYRVLKPDSWMVAFFDIRKITYSNKQRQFFDAVLPIISKALRNDPEELLGLLNLANESMGLAYWMEEAGFDFVQVLPHIWAKPNKSQGLIGDPKKGFIVSYEAILIAGKGDPFLVRQGRQNIWIYDTLNPSERDFALQMPEDFCTELVSTFCLGNSQILDPFAGIGSFGIGALNNQCSFKGFELDPARAKKANVVLQEHILAEKKES